MILELNDDIQKICNCSTCEHSQECKHCDSFRRYPIEYGGTGACTKLRLENKEVK